MLFSAFWLSMEIAESFQEPLFVARSFHLAFFRKKTNERACRNEMREGVTHWSFPLVILLFSLCVVCC